MFLFTLAHASEREYPRYCNPPAYHCCGPAFRVGARGKEVIKREHMYSMHSLITLTATIIVGRQPCTEPCTCTCFFYATGYATCSFFTELSAGNCSLSLSRTRRNEVSSLVGDGVDVAVATARRRRLPGWRWRRRQPGWRWRRRWRRRGGRPFPCRRSAPWRAPP